MFGLAAWKPSASVLTSGVEDRPQPAMVMVTGPVAAAVGVSEPPQAARTSDMATAADRTAGIERFIRLPPHLLGMGGPRAGPGRHPGAGWGSGGKGTCRGGAPRSPSGHPPPTPRRRPAA